MRRLLFKIIALAVTLYPLSTACTRTTPDVATLPAVPPQGIEVPVTVEVTRIVTQQIYVEVTPTPTPPCPHSEPSTQNAIIIGAIIPLSRPGSILDGFAMQTAFDIAVNEINSSGGIMGRPVHLVTYDSAGIAERGAKFAERLIQEDCAVAIIGLYHDAVALAVAHVAHTHHVPVIVAHATSNQITELGYPEVFRISPAQTMLANMSAQWLSSIGDYNSDGVPFAVLIVETSASDSEPVTRLQSALTEYSFDSAILPVDLPSSDFSSLIARIVTLEQLPDALFIFTKGESGLTIQSQIMAAGIGPENNTLIVSNQTALDSQLFWNDVPDGTGTLVPRVGAWHTTISQLGQSFAFKYSHYADNWPSANAFAAYDALYLVGDAIRRAPNRTGEALITALETSDIALASGDYHFPYTQSNPFPSDTPAYLWHQWPDPPVLMLQYTHPDQPSADMSVVWPPLYSTVDTSIVR